MGSANGSLELIGRVTGILDQARNQGQGPVQITRITVVLPEGVRGCEEIIESRELRPLLPKPRPELESSPD